jgi:hypothetical protein
MILSLALREREFRAISWALGTISFLLIFFNFWWLPPQAQMGRLGGQMQEFSKEASVFFTQRSSTEW